MKIYNTVSDAYSEMTRDLSKSPITDTFSVQHLSIEGKVHEAIGYSYTILDIPPNHFSIVSLAVGLGYISGNEARDYQSWLVQESANRKEWRPYVTTETENPHLRQLTEHTAPSYTYTDRMRGAIDVMVAAIEGDPTTRRAYWPMFDKEDAVRASRQTRIPCTLGYQVMLREIDGIHYLHLIYVQRSCDFNKFWLWDVYLARQFQINVYQNLMKIMPLKRVKNLQLGHFSHMILSLHSFIGESAEIY